MTGSIERDSYLRGRRLRDLGNASALIIASEYTPEIPEGTFKKNISATLTALSEIARFRRQTFEKAGQDLVSMIYTPFVETPYGIKRDDSGIVERLRDWSDEKYEIQLDIVAASAKRIREGAQPEYEIDELLARKQKRIGKLSEAVMDLARQESRENSDEVFVFDAPIEIFEYYNSQREKNNTRVAYEIGSVIDLINICSEANGIAFKPLIKDYRKSSG